MSVIQSKILRPLAFVFFVGLLTGCGEIPKAYRGKFLDRATGARLDLSSGGGSFTPDPVHGVPAIRAKARSLKYEDLLKARAGIYLKLADASTSVLEVYWIQPDPKTLQSDSGWVWYEAQVLATRFELNRLASQQTPVEQFEVFASDNGLVTLDTQTKTWQVGWAPKPKRYEFTRLNR